MLFFNNPSLINRFSLLPFLINLSANPMEEIPIVHGRSFRYHDLFMDTNMPRATS